MSKRKFKRGILITSLDELFKHEYFFHTRTNKTFHFGWCLSWPVRMAHQIIEQKQLFVAVRLTNGEYYAHKSDEQIEQMLGDKLCDFCPLSDGLKGVHCYGGQPVMCEGAYCKGAVENWRREDVE